MPRSPAWPAATGTDGGPGPPSGAPLLPQETRAPALWVPLCSWALGPATWKEQEKVLSREDTERKRPALPAASSRASSSV